MGNNLQASKNLSKNTQTFSDKNQKPIEEAMVPKRDFPAVYSVINAPKKCPDGQKLDAQGRCREILWKKWFIACSLQPS